MHEETLYLETKNTLEKIQGEKILDNFYLAGDTALSLQLGHRKSIDLDFFSKEYPSYKQLLQELNKYSPTVIQQAPGTLDVFIDNVKTSFFEYRYEMLEKLISYKEIKLAGIMDIACMKLVAVSQRGAKKDFVDLYTILQKKDFEDIYNAFGKKYAGTKYQKLHILKSLVYFHDADKDPEPDYITPIKWGDVKGFFKNLVLQIKNSSC